VRLLRASMAWEDSARGERARELGIQARDRINVDFNVDNPDTPPRASQKLIAAATLLWAMLAPSTPEARNLHREAQALIEQAAVQQAESSASRIRQQGDARGDGGAQGANPRCTQAERRSDPPTRDAHRLKNGSSTRAGKRGTATPAMSSMLEGRAKRTRERRQATTLDEGDAMTAMKTARRRRNPRGPVCSAGRSARWPSPSASANPRPSSSITGKRIPACGSTTTA
jgi:hypothetical protein